MSIRGFAIAMCALLICAVPSSGFLHSVVPHSHGEHSRSGEASVVWNSLHGALRHEEGEVSPGIVGLALIFSLVAAGVFSLRAARAYALRAAAVEPQRGEMLWRGIEVYRKFG